MKQRILSAILCLCMMLALLPASVFAEGGVTGDIPEGLVIEGTVVTDYTGVEEELIIPEGVTAIGDFAFTDNKTKAQPYWKTLRLLGLQPLKKLQCQALQQSAMRHLEVPQILKRLQCRR